MKMCCRAVSIEKNHLDDNQDDRFRWTAKSFNYMQFALLSSSVVYPCRDPQILSLATWQKVTQDLSDKNLCGCASLCMYGGSIARFSFARWAGSWRAGCGPQGRAGLFESSEFAAVPSETRHRISRDARKDDPMSEVRARKLRRLRKDAEKSYAYAVPFVSAWFNTSLEDVCSLSLPVSLPLFLSQLASHQITKNNKIAHLRAR